MLWNYVTLLPLSLGRSLEPGLRFRGQSLAQESHKMPGLGVMPSSQKAPLLFWRLEGQAIPLLYLLPSVDVCSVHKSYLTLYDPMDYSTPGFSALHYLLEFAQTHVHWFSDVIQPSYPLLPSSPPALNLSQHQSLSQWVSSSHQVAKYCSFTFSISHSIEYSGLSSFRINWFDLLAVQGTLKSLLQDHNLKA